MNPWSARRKVVYLSVFFILLFGVVVIPIFFFLYKQPTCFDGKKNDTEVGVDCGGTCQLLCRYEALNPTVLWNRAFKVGEGVYSLVAYIQNPNINSETFAPYVFKLYDSNNTLIVSRTGATHIPKNSVVALFEPNINAGSKVPARVTFEFTGKLEWRQDPLPPPIFVITQNIFSSQGGRPRVDAVIENKSEETVERVEVVAIAYDDQGNAITASRTFVDRLEKDQSTRISFTWREPFTASQVEIIPRIIPKSW